MRSRLRRPTAPGTPTFRPLPPRPGLPGRGGHTIGACRVPRGSCWPAGGRHGWARPRRPWSGMARRCCGGPSASSRGRRRAGRRGAGSRAGPARRCRRGPRWSTTRTRAWGRCRGWPPDWPRSPAGPRSRSPAPPTCRSCTRRSSGGCCGGAGGGGRRAAGGARLPAAAGRRLPHGAGAARREARRGGAAAAGVPVRRVPVTRLDEAALRADPVLAALDPDLDSVVNVNEPADYQAARARPAPEVTIQRFGPWPTATAARSRYARPPWPGPRPPRG